ncbi:regulator of telomere elongation helicase 1 [Stylonychia lemnae]|uniref:Regulator of telomere elongation helicase 1 n=1 Tax=Stylonychia lemnae TaxID=5949 RepID=A0A078APP0_STYLE|nr:regulator of telomere elongation helicase 1 [Stylonychia lemnae]|eukprot:CDW84129.1 regulator of telomere elongation helicase 1 [Stylonychia lemnae]
MKLSYEKDDEEKDESSLQLSNNAMLSLIRSSESMSIPMNIFTNQSSEIFKFMDSRESSKLTENHFAYTQPEQLKELIPFEEDSLETIKILRINQNQEVKIHLMTRQKAKPLNKTKINQMISTSADLKVKSKEIINEQYSFQTNGIDIIFPFKPYESQVDFMTRLINALNNGENALLESPTGTGKTLSLLCASLAWLKYERKRQYTTSLKTNGKGYVEPIQIIYTSRTHSQLAQVQKELKSTAYNPRSLLLASRDHLCVHEDKDRASGADLLFMPYNFMIDPKIREIFEFKFKNSIIIFDEAHNVPQQAEDASSFELETKQLEFLIQNLQNYLDDYDLDQRKVKDFYIDKQNMSGSPSVVMPGRYIFEIIFEGSKFILHLVQYVETRTTLENLYEILKKIMNLHSQGPLSQKNLEAIDREDNAQGDDKQNDADDYYVYIYEEEEENQQMHFNKNKRSGKSYFLQKTCKRILAFWCFNAGICFRELQTLQPNTDQVQISILTKGVKQNSFNFSYQNRENEKALIDLGVSIQQISKVTPGGILVFFPSYRYLRKCDELWENSNIKQQIEKFKRIFLEPKELINYKQTMDSYYKTIFNEDQNESNNGAILMGVCRGRISEGLDFSDNAARCVIVVGIPYPLYTDPKVILKRNYLDKKLEEKRSEYMRLSGKDWYSQCGIRAVNQAIGRVIRHVQDYGSIILVDQRFGWGGIKNQISKWLRDRILHHDDCHQLIDNLSKFYLIMSKRGFKAKVQQLAQLKLELLDENTRELKRRMYLKQIEYKKKFKEEQEL